MVVVRPEALCLLYRCAVSVNQVLLPPIGWLMIKGLGLSSIGYRKQEADCAMISNALKRLLHRLLLGNRFALCVCEGTIKCRTMWRSFWDQVCHYNPGTLLFGLIGAFRSLVCLVGPMVQCAKETEEEQQWALDRLRRTMRSLFVITKSTERREGTCLQFADGVCMFLSRTSLLLPGWCLHILYSTGQMAGWDCSSEFVTRFALRCW